MLSQKIKNKAIELGYTACGIIPADAFDEYLNELDKRSGLFPESKHLYDDFRSLSEPPEGSKCLGEAPRLSHGSAAVASKRIWTRPVTR